MEKRHPSLPEGTQKGKQPEPRRDTPKANYAARTREFEQTYLKRQKILRDNYNSWNLDLRSVEQLDNASEKKDSVDEFGGTNQTFKFDDVLARIGHDEAQARIPPRTASRRIVGALGRSKTVTNGPAAAQGELEKVSETTRTTSLGFFQRVKTFCKVKTGQVGTVVRKSDSERSPLLSSPDSDWLEGSEDSEDDM